MIKISLSSADVKKAVDNIKVYELAKKAAIKKQVAISAFKVQKDAKIAAPVGTPESTGIKGYKGGRLRASIAIDFKDNGMGAEVGTNVKYAPFVEFGTSKMNAQPFLYPAAEAERQNFINNIRKILSTK